MDLENSADSVALQEALEHLNRVINGSAFYLNTVRLKQSEILQCCESYWYEQTGVSSDSHMEIHRLQSMAGLARLIHEILLPLDSISLTQINEHLNKIFPSKPVYSLESGSYPNSPNFDAKLLTSVMAYLLIDVCICLSGTDHHRTSSLIKNEIISVIDVKFLRPCFSLLWSCAKQELQT